MDPVSRLSPAVSGGSGKEFGVPVGGLCGIR